jgi:hypothetical protein
MYTANGIIYDDYGREVGTVPAPAAAPERASRFGRDAMRQKREELINAATGAAEAGISSARTGAAKAKGLIGKYPLRSAGLAGAALTAAPRLLGGDVLGAGATAGGAVLGGLLGAPLGPGGVFVGSTLGGMLAGGAVDATKAAVEKAPQAISIPTPFGDLPLNVSAQQLKSMEQLGELGATQQRNAMGVYTSGLIDLNKKISDQDYANRQRDFPLMQAEQNADLARSQALINTQNNAYMQQMVLGGATNMMLDAQRERGALMRQAIATNPYVTALSGPNVSIG